MNVSSYKKRTILTTLSVFLLFGCGPSPEEIAEQERLAEEARVEQERLEMEAKFAEQKRRNDIATITCNVMAESRNMDAAIRIKEINLTRESLGEDLYLGTDEGIKESFKYGLCKELVLNDPDYNSKLLSNMKIIAEKLEQDLERKRVAEAKKREKERIAAEKKAIEVKKNIPIWSENFKKVLNDYPIEATLTKAEFKFGKNSFGGEIETIKYFHTCKNLKGLGFDIVFVFKNNLGEMRIKEGNRHTRSNSNGSCPASYETWELKNDPLLYHTFPEQVVDLFYDEELPTIEVFESVYIELTGAIVWNIYKHKFKDPREQKETEKLLKRETYDIPFGTKLDPKIVKTKYQIYP